MGLFWTASKKAEHKEKLQDKQNQANLELHQMDNNFNEKMAEKANQWNIDQWNREVDQQNLNWERDAEYNSASAQVERYREAGLNPTIMMQGQGAGSASSQSVPHASSATASAAGAIPMGKPDIPYPDYNQVFGNLQNSLNQFVDSTLKVEQVQGMKLENQRKQQQMLYELMQARNNAKGSELDNFLKQQEYNQRNAISKSQIDEARFRAETQEYERNLKKETVAYQQLVNNGYPQKLAAEIAHLKFTSQTNWEQKANVIQKWLRESNITPNTNGATMKSDLMFLLLWLGCPRQMAEGLVRSKTKDFNLNEQQPINDVRR